MDGAKYIIRNPKLTTEGFSFSPDSELLAVAERHDCKVRAFILHLSANLYSITTHLAALYVSFT